MKFNLDLLINWSETLCLLIPLYVIRRFRPWGPAMKLIIRYVIIAFIINFLSNTVAELWHRLPPYINNNVLYNLHSIVRVYFLSTFLLQTKQLLFRKFLVVLGIMYALFVIINFTFLQNPLILSNTLLSAESIVLLTFSLSFVLGIMLDDSKINWLQQPALFIGTGILLYETINFFSFLFYYLIEKISAVFLDNVLTAHNIVYVIFCIFLAVALKLQHKNVEQMSTT